MPFKLFQLLGNTARCHTLMDRLLKEKFPVNIAIEPGESTVLIVVINAEMLEWAPVAKARMVKNIVFFADVNVSRSDLEPYSGSEIVDEIFSGEHAIEDLIAYLQKK